jgi:hypothetical protein
MYREEVGSTGHLNILTKSGGTCISYNIKFTIKKFNIEAKILGWWID